LTKGQEIYENNRIISNKRITTEGQALGLHTYAAASRHSHALPNANLSPKYASGSTAAKDLRLSG